MQPSRLRAPAPSRATLKADDARTMRTRQDRPTVPRLPSCARCRPRLPGGAASGPRLGASSSRVSCIVLWPSPNARCCPGRPVLSALWPFCLPGKRFPSPPGHGYFHFPVPGHPVRRARLRVHPRGVFPGRARPPCRPGPCPRLCPVHRGLGGSPPPPHRVLSCPRGCRLLEL